jgi:hypothetical protein
MWNLAEMHVSHEVNTCVQPFNFATFSMYVCTYVCTYVAQLAAFSQT